LATAEEISMKLNTGVAACLVALTLSPMAFAAADAASAAQQRYQQERARCLAGPSHQDREDCLREAGAALQESRRGGLATEGGGLAQNAIERCNAQPPADRAACVARIQGGGKSEGSVEGGGIIRETETKIQ
jgi:hypothetical protein